VAHEASSPEAAAGDATAYEASSHEAAAGDATAYEASSHEAAAGDATAYDEASSQEAAARGVTAHEAGSPEAPAPDATANEAAAGAAAHDVAAHDVAATRDEAAHDAAKFEASAYEAETHAERSHEATEHEALAQEATARDASPQEAEAHGAEAHGAAPLETPAPDETLSDSLVNQASSASSQESTTYDPAAFPVNRPLEESAHAHEPVSEANEAHEASEPTSFEQPPAEETSAHTSPELAPAPKRQSFELPPASDLDLAAPAHQSSIASDEDTFAAEAPHANDTESRWGTPEAFPLPEPLDPFPAELAPPKGFPREAVDAFDSLDLSLPPRLDAGAIEPSLASLDTHPVAEPEISASQAIPPLPTAPTHVADEIAAGTAGAAAVAGLGAARFGALNLDFDLELPLSPSQPLPLFTPEDMGRIARNKLELASEYIELGDLAGARALIHEVIEANDAPTRTEARALLSTLAPLS
jgi:FimV-like protein